MTEEIPLPPGWPVEVNYHEADSFCRWLSARDGVEFRLPSEMEWHALHRIAGVPTYPTWAVAPGNIDLAFAASPCPADRFPHGPLFDVIGNVWQWTSTPIDRLAGFRPHEVYADFSIPTFDGKHNIIKGGSWISTGNEAHFQSRYAFRRHFFQHAGFRVVTSDIERREQG